MIDSSVVLPLPDGPIISRNSPPATSSETSTSACIAVARYRRLGDPATAMAVDDEDACHDPLNTMAGSMRVTLLMDTIDASTHIPTVDGQRRPSGQGSRIAVVPCWLPADAAGQS